MKARADSRMISEIALEARADSEVSSRLIKSASTATGSHLLTVDFADWLARRSQVHQFKVERIPFAELSRWSFAPTTGNLVHDSGRFFSIEGLDVTVRDHSASSAAWQQPIIVQKEIGILGILAQEFDG